MGWDEFAGRTASIKMSSPLNNISYDGVKKLLSDPSQYGLELYGILASCTWKR